MSQRIQSKPRHDGFRMPGEFEEHSGCWMLWPERTDNWRLSAKPAQKTFSAVAAEIAQFEPVTMGVSASQFLNAREMLPTDIRVVEMAANDSWMRDCGPTFIVNDRGDVRGVDWEFNAWGGEQGGLYSPWDLDELVAQKVLNIERLARYKAEDFVLEGGAIHVDGQGTLITTEECLLNPNRNPHLTREEIERMLKDYLNVDCIIWLGRGTYNDETDGHVDNLCCFIRPGMVALTWTEDRNDPQFEISSDAYHRLSRERDAYGRKLEIHKIHQPDPILITVQESQGIDAKNGTYPRNTGDRLAASYINFYIANAGVVMPFFDDPHDVIAYHQLQELFPDRKVVGVYAREIMLGGGNIHCITQQQPLG